MGRGDGRTEVAVEWGGTSRWRGIAVRRGDGRTEVAVD